MGKGLQEQSLSAALCAQPRSRLCRLDPQSSPGSQRGPQAPAHPKCTHAAPKSATAQPRRCSGFPFAHPEPEAGTAATRRCRGEGGTPSSRGLDTVEEQEAAEGHRGAQPQPISPARTWRCPRNAPTARGGEGKHGGATTLPALGAARNNPSGVKQRGINLLPTGVPKPTAGTGFGKHPLRGPPCLLPGSTARGGRQGCPRSGDRLCGRARHLRLRPPVTEGSQHPTLVDLGLLTPKPAPAAFPLRHLPHPKAEGAGGCGGGCCHPPPPSGARANLGVPGAGWLLPVPMGKRKAQRNGELLVPSSGGELGVK